MRRRQRGQGRTVDRLTGLLIDALNAKYTGKSIGIAPEDFWWNEGGLSHMTWDLARWGAEIPLPGTKLRIGLYSYDTMTQCVKSGIELLQGRGDTPLTFEVSAKA